MTGAWIIHHHRGNGSWSLRRVRVRAWVGIWYGCRGRGGSWNTFRYIVEDCEDVSVLDAPDALMQGDGQDMVGCLDGQALGVRCVRCVSDVCQMCIRFMSDVCQMRRVPGWASA